MRAVAGVDAATRSTLPGRLAHLARTRPRAVAIREKHLGIWRETTWSQYYARVRATGLALADLGVGPRDRVAILSDNRPEWLYADLGAQGIGAWSVGIYPTSSVPQVASVLRHSATTVLICENQEQVDKAAACAPQTPGVRRVVVLDPRGTRGADDPRLITWDELLRRGEALDRADPSAFERRLGQVDPDAPCMVVYTSGTTGPPKGALISSRNVTGSADAAARRLGVSERDTLLSYLPLCHIAEKIFSEFLPLTTGATVHFGESIDTVQEDLREVSPTVFLGVPRIWEKLQATIEVKAQDASALKRALYRFWARRGRELALRRLEGPLGPGDRLRWLLGDLLVFRALQERIGLRRCWFPVSGTAPLAPEVVGWFHGIGVRIAEGYGLTECTGASHVNPPDRIKVGTVGPPLPGVECRIARDGEVLIRGPGVFAGYLDDPEATRAAVDADGWLHTGDLGQVDGDGYLRITGRKKDIIITAGGKNLSPEEIENVLKTSPFVKEAVVVGDGRRFVSALIQVDPHTVGSWATRRGIPFTSFADLSSRPEVRDLIAHEVDRLNRDLARVERVKAFRLLPKELRQDDDELTPTMKVKRRVFEQRFSHLIEEMYR